MTTIRGTSFHSVKGGVGKSTLAVATAVELARTYPDAPVVLLDFDLTGTSLADVLPLRAPCWSDGTPLDRAKLERVAPDAGFAEREATRARINARSDALETSRGVLLTDLHAPFLNDFLLHTPTDRGDPRDVRVESILWELNPTLANLRVVPSSAIPGDLERIMPVIFDEQHAAFLEARIEVLLDGLLAWAECHARWKNSDTLHVVVDVPPTIPGLSRSIMSLGLRLSGPADQRELSEDGGLPSRLKDASIAWRINLVATRDLQDLRATLRWIRLIEDQERDRFGLWINRASGVDAPGNKETYVDALLGDLGPKASAESILEHDELLKTAFFVGDAPHFRFFNREVSVEGIADCRVLEGSWKQE